MSRNGATNREWTRSGMSAPTPSAGLAIDATSSGVDEYWIQFDEPISCSKETSLARKHWPGASQSAPDLVWMIVRPPNSIDESRSIPAGSRTASRR